MRCCGFFEGGRMMCLAQEGSFELFPGRVELIHLKHRVITTNIYLNTRPLISLFFKKTALPFSCSNQNTTTFFLTTKCQLIIQMIEQQHQSFQKLSRQPQQIQSSRHSRKSGDLHQPINHSSNTPHSEIVRDPIYRSNFGLRERIGTWLFNCFKCNNSDSSFINSIDEAERRAPAGLSQDLKKLLGDKILKLKICETSRLQLDPNVMHPFVRVHIINKNTGCYILNLQKTEEPVVYHYEELTSYNKIEKRYQANENDIILPFATALCDFRALGNSNGIWNQKFFINYPAHLLMHPDTLFLFEVLDFNHQALVYRNDEDTFDRNNFYRVAWSFLRPVGLAKTHLGKFQLQMYRYKYNNSSTENLNNKSFIPDVYYDFLWNNHEKYEGFLTVQLNYCPRPKYRFVQEGKSPSNLFQEDKYDKKYLQKFQGEEVHPQQQQKGKISQQLLKFYRNREISEIPKQLVYKFQSQLRGCYRLKFIGNYLYAGCSNKKNTFIKVFNLEKGQHVMTLKGHRGVIYKIDSTPNDKLMVTAGSDSLVKIWKIPEDTGEYIDEDQSQELILGECIHTAAVYSVSLVYQPLQDMLFILTCCYDGYIRLWECKTTDHTCIISKEILINDYTRSAGKVYPTTSAVSQGSYFIVGDSLGQIRVYDFSREKLTLRCLLSPQQLKGDAILTIHILNKNHLMIQAKDNLIRHFQLNGNKIRLHQVYSGGIYDSQMVNCSISPDNKYLLAPSQAGKPLLWDVFTGTQINIQHLNLNLKGKLICCDWHPKYNLVAISGFVDYCPIFVYGNILSQSEIKMVSAQIQ